MSTHIYTIAKKVVYPTQRHFTVTLCGITAPLARRCNGESTALIAVTTLAAAL